jgi:hypothetical protein
VVNAARAYQAWGYKPLLRGGRITLRRVDILLGAGFVACVSFYGWHGGLVGAAQGAFAFAFVALCALWL